MSQILISPIITEKSMADIASGKYIFKVDRKANKNEIAKEVKKTYKVEVVSVNIINIRSKERRFRFRQVGRTSQWKKAIVTLKKGQKIEGFEIEKKRKS